MKSKLQAQIDKALSELLSGKSPKTVEEKNEIRANINLAIKWQSVLMKQDDKGWGAAFKNGEAMEESDDDSRGGDDE